VLTRGSNAGVTQSSADCTEEISLHARQRFFSSELVCLGVCFAESEGFVAKPALGRGLENLMNQGKGTAASAESGQEGPSLSPGMATLLKAGNGGPKPQERSPTEPALEESARSGARDRRSLRISLVLADLLLVGLAASLVFKSGGHFGFIETLLCVAALALGAWLSCLALWRN
jgi:hypothetical protein